MSKAAVLCNGPSRVAYTISTEYDYIIGCNVPWTECDSTVVVDDAIIKLWNEDSELIKCKVHYSERAWEAAEAFNNPLFKERALSVRPVRDKQSHSSGHVAVEIMIEQGYTEIDIFGCDAWFNIRSGDSFTRQYVPIQSPNQELRMASRMQGWKLRWQNIIQSNPNVKINFIK